MRRQLRSDAAMAVTILVLAASLTASGYVLLQRWLVQDQLRRSFGFEDALGALAALVGGAVVLWWLASLLLAVVSGLLALGGRRRSAELTGRLAPRFMRRLILAMLGFNLLAGPLAQASEPPIDPLWQPTVRVATAPTAPDTPDTSSVGMSASSSTGSVRPDRSSPDGAGAPSGPAGPSAVSPLWQPQAPLVSPGPLAPPSIRAIFPIAGAPARAAPGAASLSNSPGRSSDSRDQTSEPSGRAAEPSDRTAEPSGRAAEPSDRGVLGPGTDVAVRAGDTLWTLAAVQLGPLATDLEIAEHWPRWFQVNRAAIGNDPNLLLPGQILRAP